MGRCSRSFVLVVLALATLGGCGQNAANGSSSQAPPAPTQPHQAGVVHPAHPVWCPMDNVGGFDARSILGLPASQAKAKVEDHGCTWRVTEIDGRGLPVTSDFRSDRVDVSLRQGNVTHVSVG